MSFIIIVLFPISYSNDHFFTVHSISFLLDNQLRLLTNGWRLWCRPHYWCICAIALPRYLMMYAHRETLCSELWSVFFQRAGECPNAMVNDLTRSICLLFPIPATSLVLHTRSTDEAVGVAVAICSHKSSRGICVYNGRSTRRDVMTSLLSTCFRSLPILIYRSLMPSECGQGFFSINPMWSECYSVKIKLPAMNVAVSEYRVGRNICTDEQLLR